MRKNAEIKITGACTLSKEPYPFPGIWDRLARIFDPCGLDVTGRQCSPPAALDAAKAVGLVGHIMKATQGSGATAFDPAFITRSAATVAASLRMLLGSDREISRLLE
jgi:hypothetical protein